MKPSCVVIRSIDRFVRIDQNRQRAGLLQQERMMPGMADGSR